MSRSQLAGQGSNLEPPDPKSGVLPVELPAMGRVTVLSACDFHDSGRTTTLRAAMGSLIKKRRKRMRKKKHKKMLKRTRFQRRK